MKKMYQIGSVVELRSHDNEKLIPFIIVGRMLQSPTGDVYDYIGLPYPYGFTGEDSFAPFAESQIENVLHDGYHTDISDELQLFYQENCER